MFVEFGLPLVESDFCGVKFSNSRFDFTTTRFNEPPTPCDIVTTGGDAGLAHSNLLESRVDLSQLRAEGGELTGGRGIAVTFQLGNAGCQLCSGAEKRCFVRQQTRFARREVLFCRYELADAGGNFVGTVGECRASVGNVRSTLVNLCLCRGDVVGGLV